MSAFQSRRQPKPEKLARGQAPRKFVDTSTSCPEMHSKAFLYTLIHGSHGSLKTGEIREYEKMK